MVVVGRAGRLFRRDAETNARDERAPRRGATVLQVPFLDVWGADVSGELSAFIGWGLVDDLGAVSEAQYVVEEMVMY